MTNRTGCPTKKEWAKGRAQIVDWLLDSAEWWAAIGEVELAFVFYRQATERMERRERDL